MLTKNRGIDMLKNTLNQFEIIDIYRSLHQTTSEYTYFSHIHMLA